MNLKHFVDYEGMLGDIGLLEELRELFATRPTYFSQFKIRENPVPANQNSAEDKGKGRRFWRKKKSK